MRRVSYHSPAAYLASAVNSGLSYEVCRYLHHSIDLYNNLVDPPDSLTPDSIDNSCSTLTQKFLSNKIEDCQFKTLFDNSTPIEVVIKWWLGIPVAQGQSCSQCNAALDAYGHHALCCKLGGDVVSRHNRLRDIFQ